ncbi:MAG: hypothetical protein JWL72_2110 [Ilumatobacteraceae bacterium]|nr:hypothetical protein [Ilumatobacteraceae bacterium]
MPTTTWGRIGRAPRAAAGFAVARARDRPLRGLVTGLGIAIAIGSLFTTAASPLIAGDATLRRSLEAVPAASRSIAVAVAVNEQPIDKLRAIDARVRANLEAPGLGHPRGQVEYRALAANDGTVYRLIGVEHLADIVTLIDGRLPTTCTPTHCEVLIIGSDTAVTPQPELGIDIVGRAVLDDQSIVAGQFRPDASEVVLLGDGVEAVGALKALELFGRSEGWIAPIDPASVRVADIGALLAAATRTANSFGESSATVTLPSKALLDARSRAATARRRVALAAAQAAVLVVGFTLLAAASMRRRHLAARDLLRQRGASRGALNVFTVCEAAWPVVIGTVIGIPLGLGVTAWLATSWNLSARDTVFSVAHTSLPVVLIGAVLVLIATAVVMANPPSERRRTRRRWWQPLPIDALGIGALAMTALSITRGADTSETLISEGDPLIAALPLLATLIVAWVAIRAVPSIVAGCARLLGRRAPLARTALGEVARRPAVPLLTAGFLAATTTLGLFSLGYRSTLAAGAHDQASFAVPLDVTLTEGSALVRPSALQPATGWSALAAGTTSTEVVRRGVSVLGQDVSSDTVTVVGIDPATIDRLAGWRGDFGPSRATLTAAIQSKNPAAAPGGTIPDDATQLVIHGSGDFLVTNVQIVVERRDGTWHQLGAKYVASAPDQLVADLDPSDAGGTVLGFSIGQAGYSSDRVQHHDGEGATSASDFTASLHFDGIDAGTPNSAVAMPWTGLASDGAVVTATDAGVNLDLRLRGTTALILPPTPPQLGQISAIVDPQTAAEAENGLVTVDVPGESRLTLRVAAVAQRFPGTAERFAVVNRVDIGRAFDQLDPGFGTPNEVWLSAAPGHEAALAAALHKAPFDQLVVSRRAAIDAQLRSNPLARFTLGLFAVAGLIAALLAIAAIYLATMSDAAEQAPLHRALAAEGVPARSLSRMVRSSGSAIALGAIAIGTVGALLLLRVVTRVIAVTATSTVPVPPLLASVPALNLVVAVVAITVPCLLGTALAARSARRAAQGDLLREFG